MVSEKKVIFVYLSYIYLNFFYMITSKIVDSAMN